MAYIIPHSAEAKGMSIEMKLLIPKGSTIITRAKGITITRTKGTRKALARRSRRLSLGPNIETLIRIATYSYEFDKGDIGRRLSWLSASATGPSYDF